MDSTTLAWVIKYIAVFGLLLLIEGFLLWNGISALHSGRHPPKAVLIAVWIGLILMIACIVFFVLYAPSELHAGTDEGNMTYMESNYKAEPKRKLPPTLIPPIFIATLVLFSCLRRQSEKQEGGPACQRSTSGIVMPRKIGFQNCMLEMTISTFLLISIPFRIIPLTTIITFVAILLWVIRVSIQNTTLLYEENSLTYCTLFSCQTYHISEIDHLLFVPVRQGGMQMQIIMKGHSVIMLEERNFLGLSDLADWIHNAKK